MASFDWREVRDVVCSDGWRASFTVEPPLDPAALAPLEAVLGPLPAAYRSFVTEVTSAVVGLHVNRPSAAVAHLIDPAATFPALDAATLAALEPRRFGFSPDEAAAAMARLAALLVEATGETDTVAGLWKLAGTEALADAALVGNDQYQGAILAIDHGCAEYIAIVHDGPLRDTVWHVTELGWYPELRLVDGQPVAHDFASFLRAYVRIV